MLGENIRRKRVEQNISQEFLAERLAISRQSISKWENGLSEPSTKNLTQLAAIFHCEVHDLIGDEARSEEAANLFVIGIAVSCEDFGKLKYFFQEMPSDVSDCYGSSFVIACSENISGKKEPVAMIEKYSGRSVLRILPGERVQPGNIYWLDNRGREGSFNEFFGSLAQQYGKNVVAVFFSGWERDGLKGIRQVKKAGGMTVLREVEKNRLDDNYRSVSGGDLFDYILEPAHMGFWIAEHIRRSVFSQAAKDGFVLSSFSYRVQESLKKLGSIPLLDLKEDILIKALFERSEACGLSSLEYYGRLLESSEEEQEKMKQSILRIFCTRKEDWTSLLELKELILNRNPEVNGMRIWLAGCGSGLDAYVIAMMLSDHMESHKWHGKLKLFATDMDEEIVSSAIQGYFSEDDIKDLPGPWKQKYFRQTVFGYQVSQPIRNMIIFSVHGVLTAPAFSRLDLLICRNVLRKFRILSRKSVVAKFSHALNQSGYLVLGRGEDIDELLLWFQNVEKYDGKVWRKQKSAPLALNTPLPEEQFSVGQVVQRLLTASIPSCVIVDERYEILYTGPEVGKYLQFKTGEFSRNLFDNMDRKLSVSIDTALKYLQQSNNRQEVMVVNANDPSLGNINIHVLSRVIKGHAYYLIWFDKPRESKQQDKVYEFFSQKEEKLEQELSILQTKLYQTMEELDNTRDRYELMNEKLHSSNEELILMNDELQVVNQELTASNRKLTRVNSEYQREINEMPDFLQDGIDFFKLMELQAIFLDRNFCIKKMSAGISDVTHVKEHDLGKDISALTLMDGYLGWLDDVKAAKKGCRIFRVLDGPPGKRYMVQILPHVLTESGPAGYVILIQTIDRQRSEHS